MVYSAYFSSGGVPSTGLTPVWSSLQDAATGAAIPPVERPVITEIGNGWYSYSMAPASALVGVIDGGVSLANADRYKSQQIQTSAATAFGSAPCTIALKDSVTNNPIPDVEVVIFNQDQSLVVNSALSNSIGQMVAQLNPGQYVVCLRKDGYNLPTLQNIVVAGAQTFNFLGSQVGEVSADFRTIVAPFTPQSQITP